MRNFPWPVIGLLIALLPAAELSAQQKAPRILWWQPADAKAEQAFLAMWAPFARECAERDLILRRVEKPADRHRLGIPSDESQMVLVGRDGLIKRRWTFDTSPQEVFAVIDAMPMRQREMEDARPRP